MAVYLVISTWHLHETVIAIFSTKERAEYFLKSKERSEELSYRIEYWPVDERPNY